MCKTTALDIANYLIYIMSDCCDDLTNMKLNKLLYYAQGHSLRHRGEPLFQDIILAWPHGPIVANVYKKYQDYGDRPIKEYDPANISHIPEDTKEILFDVAREYGKYTASTLRNMTHRPDSPWSEVYKEGERDREIPLASIRSYFQNIEPAISPLKPLYYEEQVVDHRDKDGYLVLPGDWADEEV